MGNGSASSSEPRCSSESQPGISAIIDSACFSLMQVSFHLTELNPIVMDCTEDSAFNREPRHDLRPHESPPRPRAHLLDSFRVTVSHELRGKTLAAREGRI